MPAGPANAETLFLEAGRRLRVGQFGRRCGESAAAERAIHLGDRRARLRFARPFAFKLRHQIGEHLLMRVSRFASLQDHTLARHVEIFDAQRGCPMRGHQRSRSTNRPQRQKRAPVLFHGPDYSKQPLAFPARQAMSLP